MGLSATKNPHWEKENGSERRCSAYFSQFVSMSYNANRRSVETRGEFWTGLFTHRSDHLRELFFARKASHI